MPHFVSPGSVVRQIWGDADTILLVFAGAAAEFALNRAVDWLFFTGELPRDPIGRLFSTAAFAQQIVFVDRESAEATLDRIRTIHGAVERARGAQIPDWAHRDVLYLLIAYSERAFELLHRPLDSAERRELYDVFRRVGQGLGIPDLPESRSAWEGDRERHLDRDLVWTPHTAALYAAYRRNLGFIRFRLLLRVQALLVPPRVRRLLHLREDPVLPRLIPAYGGLVRAGLRSAVHRLLMPPQYLDEVRRLDRCGTSAQVVQPCNNP